MQTLDAANPCIDVQRAATFVDSSAVGPVSGESVAIPITPTTGGELLVVTVAGASANTRYVRMVDGQPVFQVATPRETCGKGAVIFSVGNIEPGVSGFTVESDYSSPSDTFVVFVMKFDGLDPGTGAKLSYNYGHGEYATAACPGTVVLSATTSCGDVVLSPESPFQAPGSIDGTAAAFYIPSAYGEYSANWRAADTTSTAIVELE